jgi:hypothetical protein
MNERDDEFVVRLHRELDALLKKEKRLRRTRKVQNRTMVTLSHCHICHAVLKPLSGIDFFRQTLKTA